MKAASTGRRGWPLVSLGIVLGGWVVLRVAMWETPFASAIAPPPDAPQTQAEAPARLSPVPVMVRQPATDDLLRAPAHQPLDRPSFDAPLTQGYGARGAANRAGLLGADRIIAHTMLLAAAYRHENWSAKEAPYSPGVGPIAPGVVYAPAAARDFAELAPAQRWSMDLWALWRDDTTTPITSGRPSYGRSQVGAVLRYRLDPSSRHAPQLHLRATRALEGASETDVALGASARPLPSVPVRLAAEARVSETAGGAQLRAAAYAVTELPPVELPGGLTGEAYVQGGYVSGDFATAFIDGQARITRELAGTDSFRLTAGGGAWGGAQDDAQRLDLGPSAGVSFRVGQARGRVSADYRFRVAGDAEPASGPALTLTAGF